LPDIPVATHHNPFFSEPPMATHNWLSSEPPTKERNEKVLQFTRKICEISCKIFSGFNIPKIVKNRFDRDIKKADVFGTQRTT